MGQETVELVGVAEGSVEARVGDERVELVTDTFSLP